MRLNCEWLEKDSTTCLISENFGRIRSLELWSHNLWLLKCDILNDLSFGKVALRNGNLSWFLRGVNFSRIIVNLCGITVNFSGFTDSFGWVNFSLSWYNFRKCFFSLEFFPSLRLLDKTFESSKILNKANSNFLTVSFQSFHEPVEILWKVNIVCLDDIFTEFWTVVINVLACTLYCRNQWDKHFLKVFAVWVFWFWFRKVSVKPNFCLKTVCEANHRRSDHEQTVMLMKSAISFHTTLHYRHYFRVLYIRKFRQSVRNSFGKKWPSCHLATKIRSLMMRKVINIDKAVAIGP